MVTPLSITLNCELDPWIDLRGNLDGRMGRVTRIGLLPDGTDQHRACVELLIETEDGRLIVAETTWRLFATAFAALAASPIALMEDM